MINNDCDKHNDDNCDDDCVDKTSFNVSVIKFENLMFWFSILQVKVIFIKQFHVQRVIWQSPALVLAHQSNFIGFFAIFSEISIDLLFTFSADQ